MSKHKNKKKASARSKEPVAKNNTLKNALGAVSIDNWFRIIILALTFFFYYNTAFNYYSLDDHYIDTSNEAIAKGISGIPEIFTSLYAEESGMAYGYRALVRTSYALEYQFTLNSPYRPYISHIINVILYMLGLLLMYNVLRRLFRNYTPWFPFLTTILFLTHPLHTEVVASLKNRDIILVFIFSFLAVQQFLKWADFNKTKHLYLGLLYFALALISKETAIAQLAVFPLVLYFYSDISLKKLGRFTLIAFVVAIVAAVGPFLFLPEFSRHMRMLENPLVNEPNWFIHLSTAFYILGWYLILLLKPYPMSFYYGYDTIPVTGWNNIWVWISLLLYLFFVFVALKGLKKKTLISFVILYFIITISPYANIVKPVPGIVADRFMFFPSLSFSMALVLLLFYLFKIDLQNTQAKIPVKKLLFVNLLVVLILIPYGKIGIYRNHIWRTKYSLYREDINHLQNSVKANDLFATECVSVVNRELAKPVNPYKFVRSLLDTAVVHYRKAVKILPDHYSSWNNMGAIYSKIHGNQALIRYRSYAKRHEMDKAKKELENSKRYFDTARMYFSKAISIKPDFASAYYNMGYSWELQSVYDSAIRYYKIVLGFDTTNTQVRSRLANAYFRNNRPDSAFYQNAIIKKIDPESDYPYINLGNYYYILGDTARAIREYEMAVKKNTDKPVEKLLIEYYRKKGNEKLAKYYENELYDKEKRLKSNRNAKQDWGR